MIGVDYPCQRCIYFHKELLDGWKTACDAYPDGIPVSLGLDGTLEELKHCKEGYGLKDRQMKEQIEKQLGCSIEEHVGKEINEVMQRAKQGIHSESLECPNLSEDELIYIAEYMQDKQIQLKNISQRKYI